VATKNVAIALDEIDHRLFVGCRKPNVLIVIDTRTGATVAHRQLVSNVDDISYDSTLKRLYLSGSNGLVNVFQQNDPDSYSQIAQMDIGTGAGRQIGFRSRIGFT
jgi:hypothetical protein